MSIRLRQSIEKTSRGGLKMKTRGFIIGAFALVLVLVATGANAYVPALGTYHPTVGDFNFVNNIGTLSWGSGATEISIAVRVSAPDGDNSNFPFGTYGSYFPDPLYAVDGFTAEYDPVTTQTSGVFTSTPSTHDPTDETTFDDMYGYFYTITLGEDYSGNLESFGFDIGPATITEVGYDDGKQEAASWAIVDNALYFNFPNGMGQDEFLTTETATVYVASEYWWGWSKAEFNGTPQETGGYNNTGKLPAPNPEAPTVALFMLGIFGLHVWRNKGLRFMANSQ